MTSVPQKQHLASAILSFLSSYVLLVCMDVMHCAVLVSTTGNATGGGRIDPSEYGLIKASSQADKSTT